MINSLLSANQFIQLKGLPQILSEVDAITSIRPILICEHKGITVIQMVC